MTIQNRQDRATLEPETLAIPQTRPAAGPSQASTAKVEAKGLARDGAGAAREVAETAVSEAGHVAQETGAQAKNLAARLGSDLKSQAGAQQQRVAEGLRSISGELRTMAQSSPAPGAATGLVEQAARRTAEVAGWLEARDPGSLLAEATGFARRRPGAFLAIAVGAGVLAGRLARGITEDRHQDRYSPGVPGRMTQGPAGSGAAIERTRA
ncbi:hypothetical protein ACFQ36_01235 [Arthrobacter sp. GCM10027362]|uniref:hypothetical protein n=1 Tax=Arthrobacter sp. GCM10027362 TaxID=3273379 RepID=UPI003641F17F